MKNYFKQLKVKEWLPTINKAVAVLKYEPDDLEKKLSIKFNESHDELDYFKIAVFELVNKKQFCLIRYKGNPSSGTEIWITNESLDINNEIDEILNNLQFNESDLKWKLKD
ncbi:MAG: hypothetical protein ABIJ59_19410 [Pseudomonadota bacterium]